MAKRMNSTHAWLIERGWRKVGEAHFGNRVQFQWQHEREGLRNYSTTLAEYAEIQAAKRGTAAPIK